MMAQFLPKAAKINFLALIVLNSSRTKQTARVLAHTHTHTHTHGVCHVEGVISSMVSENDTGFMLLPDYLDMVILKVN